MLQEDFLNYLAKTTPSPLGLPVARAAGSYIWDTAGNSYLDFVAGVSACSIGHCHPKVVAAIQAQSERYLHVMVYGEFAQQPAVDLAQLLVHQLPNNHEKVYLTNSGTEAIEGALKLAKRATGRTGIIAAKNSYHGSTQGALSVTGYEPIKTAYRPLLNDVRFITFNAEDELGKITPQTAAVLLETIQGGAGFIVPTDDYLAKVKARCEAVGALLILDEIQPGFGRTGRLFGFEHYDVIPDILVMGKGMGGGLPIGAFTASTSLMDCFTHAPMLGHITTFGGHPLIAAAAHATLNEILDRALMDEIESKEKLFRKALNHPKILRIHGKGLMLAPMVASAEIAQKVIETALSKGLILFGLLWEKRAIRISPPLTISEQEILKGCKIITDILDDL